MPRIAAAIVHYGPAAATRACLRALAAATCQVDTWVVDNGPPGALDGLEAETVAGVLEPGGNLGYGGALNLVAARLLAAGSHDALLCLNNDALVEPAAPERLAAALGAEPRRAAAVPRILMDGPSGERLWYGGGEIDWLRGSARVEGVGGAADAPGAMRGRDVGFATGCALLLRLEALQRAGGFDARYFLYEEDVELSLRLRAAGWRLRYVPGAVVRHAGQASQRAPDEPFIPIHRADNPRAARLVELAVSNRLLTVSRHAGPAHRLAFATWFPVHWTRRCVEGVLRGRPGIAAAVWRGLCRYRRLRRQPAATALVGSGLPETSPETSWSPS